MDLLSFPTDKALSIIDRQRKKEFHLKTKKNETEKYKAALVRVIMDCQWIFQYCAAFQIVSAELQHCFELN